MHTRKFSKRDTEVCIFRWFNRMFGDEWSRRRNYYGVHLRKIFSAYFVLHKYNNRS